jgi:LmbE family N-acetylglucosaminyl deacetylase
MKTVLVLSSHLDDAAFSVGPLLAELRVKARVVVATVFTKSIPNPEGFALTCQLDKGLTADVDYMHIRRQEDKEWAKKLGVEVVHGPFAEAPHRGYQSAKELFAKILETDRIETDLGVWLEDLIESLNPEMVLTPLGLGNHVDHQWVRKTAETFVSNLHTLAYYRDQPYAVKMNEGEIHAQLGEVNPAHSFHSPIGQASLDCAVTAAEAYSTQIPFQFGDIDAMDRVLRSAWGAEMPLFHTPGIPEYLEFLS